MIRVVDILNKKSKEKSYVCFDLFYIIHSNPIEVLVFVKENDEKVTSSRLLDLDCKFHVFLCCQR